MFTDDEIRKCYNKIYRSHGLPPSQAKKVVQELESHTGLFIQVGYNSFQFSHKSIQEFLTAKYLYSLPKIPEHEILKQIPEETAIAVSLSSSPNTYFESFLKDFTKQSEHFWPIFIDRLIEEKPDFDENPAVLVFFLDVIQKGYGTIFRNRLFRLYEATNLKITNTPFLKHYKKNQSFQGSTTYLHKTIGISLEQRNHFPSTINITDDIAELVAK